MRRGIAADDRSAVNTLRQANDLAEALDSPHLGVVFDVYHLWWDPDLPLETERCGRSGRLFAFHVCDWKTPTEDLLLDPPQPERAFRRRVGLLRRRLSSLTVPAPLRRALTAAVGSLERATATDASTILSLLAAPARDTVGPEVGDALARSARAAR